MSVSDIHGRTASRETSWIAPTLAVIVPKGSFTVLDDWGDMLGIRGSGANAVVLKHGMRRLAAGVCVITTLDQGRRTVPQGGPAVRLTACW